MKRIDLIPRIRELYENGENIISFLKKQDQRNFNTIEDILISYDFQAGNYVRYTKEHPDYNNAYTTAIAEVLKGLGACKTLMEAGVGEATTLANVALKLGSRSVQLLGFDISWSRVNCGRNYVMEKGLSANLFVADLFKIPLPDNAIDIVYTSHSIEPNGGKEKEALCELYRITGSYLVLLEPTFEFADEAGKSRMRQNGYVQHLKQVINELGYNLIEYRPFPVTANPLNPTGLYIIKKEDDRAFESFDFPGFRCPFAGDKLKEYSDHYFSPSSLLSYPIISGIPCLYPTYGILTSKHE